MTIEEKAKRYDEAIKYGRYLINERCKEGTDGSFHCVDLQKMFPELKESGDERMKNAAIRACKYMIDNFENSTKDYEDAIAWLEKQGEQKPVDIEAIKTEFYNAGYEDGKEFMQNPVEWSKEDEERLRDTINTLVIYKEDTNVRCSQSALNDCIADIDWLKSFRPQNRWKPTKVQMKALRSAIHSYGTHCGSDPLYHVVLTLENDLRAL